MRAVFVSDCLRMTLHRSKIRAGCVGTGQRMQTDPIEPLFGIDACLWDFAGVLQSKWAKSGPDLCPGVLFQFLDTPNRLNSLLLCFVNLYFFPAASSD